MTVLPQTVFAQRAAFYTTSAMHQDKAVLDRLVELAHVQPADRVLDVATGTGHTAFALASQVREVIAIDVTPEMLAEGEKLKEGRGLRSAPAGMRNVEFRIADAHDLPFDVATCRRADVFAGRGARCAASCAPAAGSSSTIAACPKTILSM